MEDEGAQIERNYDTPLMLDQSEIIFRFSSISEATMVISRKGFFLVLHLALLCVVNGDIITRTPLQPPQGMACLEECQILDNGTLVIINITNPKQAVSGVAYAKLPVRMKDPATRTVASFNTSFTFREEPESYNLSDQRSWKRGDGFTFAFVNSSTWVGGAAGRFGMFSINPLDNARVVAIEYDSWSNVDTDSGLQQAEHVGVDIATAISLNGSVYPDCFAYVYDTLGITFWQRDVLYSWIEYDGTTNMLQVRLANTSSRPLNPLVHCKYDLYDVVDEMMWIGFSGAHGDAWSVYYIYNWTFSSFGISGEFSSDPSSKPSLNIRLVVGVCGGIMLALIVVAVGACICLRRKRAEDESCDTEGLLEMSGMPEFISYKLLSAATNQFSDQSKLGAGGFGNVYKGVLPKTGAHVAVKKVSNDSKQGRREFLAEVRIISQLRHRNVVELVGFCRDRGKFLLVYELLPKGSLDQALFKPKSPEDVLSWSERWKIASGTAAALHYLHEGWRQQVIHRDVKSSNIMFDDEFNAKLGDFGLARLVDHQKNAATTMVGGTYGYLAPEASGGKFTDKTDVYAFGAVALELACGRKAFAGSAEEDDMLLVDMVWRRLKEGNLLSVVDSRLNGLYNGKEIELLLLLGLLCSHPSPAARPYMRQVVQMLAGEAPLPPVPTAKPEPVFSADVVSFYKRKLSSPRLRTKSGLLLRSVSGKSTLLDGEHSTVTIDSELTGPLSSFPSDSSSNPDMYLLSLSKTN